MAACREVLRKVENAPVPQIRTFAVPGSLEIPLMAQRLANSRQFEAIFAFGWIVDGGIYRHEFVSQTVLDGLMRVQLDTGVPVFSAVLTPVQFDESPTRLEFFRNHLVGKGQELAAAALAFVPLLQSIPVSAAPEGPESPGDRWGWAVD